MVKLGGNSLTERVIAEIDFALNHHELIKVKVPSDDRDEKTLIMDAIVGETKSYKVQTIGHVLVIYKPSKDPVIKLPRK